MKKGVIYYTNNNCDEIIFNAVIKRLSNICENKNIEIISISQKSINFGNNIIMDLPSKTESIFRQIYKGLQVSTADIVYLVEHDVLYHPSHFDLVPIREDVFYYNRNVWQVDYQTGEAIFKISRRTSQVVSYKESLLNHYKKWVEIIDERGYNYKMGVSPRVHKIVGLNHRGIVSLMSAFPNIDIRHEKNISKFRYKNEIKANGVPFWGITLNNFDKYLI